MPDPHFSSRTLWEFRENPLTLLVRELHQQGRELRDWTVSNPTLCGFPYDRDCILSALADPAALIYAPDPSGIQSAREAVARFLSEHHAPVTPDRILLTSSSSEAYAYLFRLLCDPGDSIAIPKPGYPLFDDLARLNDVRLAPYRFRYAGGWHLDEATLRGAMISSTRAIVVIHPNNPTGTYLTPEEQEMVAHLAREYGVPVIADEVFLSYPFSPHPPPVSCASLSAQLVFTLNGLSKAAGLPQMKLGWIALQGDEVWVREALKRLEIIADTYLSVSTPVQVGLEDLLGATEALGRSIQSRVMQNYTLVGNAVGGSPISLLRAEGGWNAILQLPCVCTDEAWAESLLSQEGLLVYPGHFFDIESEACVVVSLLPPHETVREYCAILRRVVEQHSR